MVLPEIKILEEKRLVGVHLKMSLTNNTTFALWSDFRSRLSEVKNRIGTDFISMQVYDASYFRNFSPSNTFTKWAAVEVSRCEQVPDKMECFPLVSGMYAVFHYKGSSADKSIFQYIFSQWLPKSGYLLDQRPHFEVLGDRYKNNDPNSEEEIWIPIRKQ